MNREQAIPYVAHVVDDAGAGRKLGSDQYAVVRPGNRSKRLDDPTAEPCYPSVLIGWQCGFEPLFVAVHSYLDVKLGDDEAVEMATDYLDEINWFAAGPTEPDFVIR